MPVRSIPRSYRSITGRLTSPETGHSYEHESLLERDCLLLFDNDPAVATIDTQPVRIDFRVRDGKGRMCARYHIPDILVHFRAPLRRPALLVEVKYEDQLRAKRELYLPKIRAARDYARQRGWLYRVFTDRRIRRAGNRIRNLNFLQSYRRDERAPAPSAALLDALDSCGEVTLRTLLERCAGADQQARNRLLPCLWRLIAVREVYVDLDIGFLSLSSLVRAVTPFDYAAVQGRLTF